MAAVAKYLKCSVTDSGMQDCSLVFLCFFTWEEMEGNIYQLVDFILLYIPWQNSLDQLLKQLEEEKKNLQDQLKDYKLRMEQEAKVCILA